MKFSHSAPPAPSQQVIRNRVFHCKMRNKHYERAFMHFRRIQGSVKSNPTLTEGEQLPALREFLEHLTICLEYADASVVAGKREKLPSFSSDRVHGILREEIILTHFLRELASSVKYMIDRIETDHQLQDFARELESYKAKNGTPDRSGGFVDRVLGSLAALKETGNAEFQQIYAVIQKRYEIGNKLFSLIRELQPFK